MKGLRPILEEAEKLNHRHALLRKKDGVVVALSGGPDSAALLALLAVWRRKYRLRLVAAHLDHGLSKEQASHFKKTAGALAARWNIPFYSKRSDVRRLAKKYKRSLEEAGRIERYAFFEEVARRAHAGKIATAHTLDDQAETVLLRILRGTALRGMAGIPVKRKHGRAEIIRPLLTTPKTTLLSFLKQNGLPYAIDRSNRLPVFTRNKVRHRLLPFLEKHFNPQIKTALAHLQDASVRAQDFIGEASRKAYDRCRAKAPCGRVRLKADALRRLHPALQAEVLLGAYAEKRGDAKRITGKHIAALMEAIAADGKDWQHHLPGPVRVAKKRQWVEFS